jgi:hypothetical protein
MLGPRRLQKNSIGGPREVADLPFKPSHYRAFAIRVELNHESAKVRKREEESRYVAPLCL